MRLDVFVGAGPARRALPVALALVGVLALGLPTAPPASAEKLPGAGIDPERLWVHMRLGQPSGGGGGGGVPAGRSIRYVKLGQQQPCLPPAFSDPPPGIRPWFGLDGDPMVNIERVEVLSVNRQDPDDRISLGVGCIAPADLVPIPSPPDAREALAAKDILRPPVQVNPTPRGLTGLESWYWAEGTDTVTVSLSSDFPGFSVSATATATGYTWSFGDGSSGHSSDPGSVDDPAARHAYDQKSGNQPYQVKLTTTWQGTYAWSGFGDSGGGPLGEVLTTSDPLPYPVSEVRSVLQ